MKPDLFTTLLDVEERKRLIEAYPPVKDLTYTPPTTVPQAQKQFKPAQSREDTQLRNFQYSLSAVFRPLDILANEVLRFVPETEAPRFLAIIRDARRLLIHSNATINQARNNLAMKAFNPQFQTPETEIGQSYTMDPTTFQQSLANQVASQDAIRKALSSY